MDVFAVSPIRLTLAALRAYASFRLVHLPTTIGVMVLALAASVGVLAAGELGVPALRTAAQAVLQRVDFNYALLHGMLAFLLLAGSLHVDLSELAAETLNTVLLVLIGLEVLVLPLSWPLLVAAAAVIPVTLLAPIASVAGVLAAVRPFGRALPGRWPSSPWGGLRGGISVALALALPANDARPALLVITYGVVVFSIIVQGLTIGTVIRRSGAAAREDAKPPGHPDTATE